MTFLGPAYTLRNDKAALDDSVNLYVVPMEVPGGKTKYTMESVPGYAAVVTAGTEIRGCFTTNDRTFWAVDVTLYEMVDEALVSRGTFLTSTGVLEFEYGTTQLVMVDGVNGYVLTLATNVFTQIGDDAFYGSARVAFLDNFFLFVRPNTGQFFVSAINDATLFDGLDYATAEAGPDDLVSLLVVQKRLLLYGQYNCEFWRDSGAADFQFEPGGGLMEVGCLAAHTPRVVDNTAYWIGRDRGGPGSVYRLNGYNAERVANDAVDQSLQSSTDLSQAVAYTYQDQGFSFYCIKAPGVPGVWVYNIKAQSWDRRCDQDANGDWIADRVGFHTYNFGKHYVGGDDGVIYRMSPDVYMKGSDPLVRQRTSPHSATPSLHRIFYNCFTVDCTTGEAPLGEEPQVELSWLDWGRQWSNWIARSAGQRGQRFPRLQWFQNVLGSGVDRTWRIRYAGNTPWSINNVDVKAKEGDV